MPTPFRRRGATPAAALPRLHPFGVACFVREQRAETCYDANQAGFLEIGNDLFHVFVRQRRFLIEQIAIVANHPAAESRLHELRGLLMLAHAHTAFASAPLAAGT